METPIKPGKYKMRNGCKAIIAAVAPSELDVTQPVVGWCTASNTEDRWTLGTWCLDGKFHIGPTQSEADLITPWIDAPVFNHWDTAPWAKALYKYSRSWILSSFIPVWDDKVEDWHHPKQNSPFTYRLTCHLIPDHCPNWDGPDKDSLILRPENV